MAPPPRVFRFLPACAVGEAGGTHASAPRERRHESAARRERAATAGAVIVSVLFHVLVVVLWPAVTIPVAAPYASVDAQPPVQVVRVRAPDAPEPVPAPVAASARPVLSPELPAVTLAVPGPAPRGAVVAVADAAAPAILVRPVAPVASVSDGDVFVRPVALSILTNWRPDVPRDGVETTIRVHTDAAGRATGLVELVPHTPSHRLDAEIAARVRELKFQPALRDGEPVAGWAEITLVMCPHGVTATSPASPSGLASPCADRARVASTKTGG